MAEEEEGNPDSDSGGANAKEVGVSQFLRNRNSQFLIFGESDWLLGQIIQKNRFLPWNCNPQFFILGESYCNNT